MKKQFAIIFFIVLFFIGANSHLLIEKTNAEGPVVIPDEAIRLRILANSDSDEDQALKRLVRDEVNKEITKWVEELTSIEAARILIKDRLPEIEKIVDRVLKRENSNQSFTVEFGNVSFPTKLYGNFLYPAGEYEAILISLGEAKGANWWCVLFPPLCFLDFSTGEAVDASDKEKEKVEEVENQMGSTDKGDENDKKEKTSKAEKDGEEVEVKFFLVEFFSNLFD